MAARGSVERPGARRGKISAFRSAVSPVVRILVVNIGGELLPCRMKTGLEIYNLLIDLRQWIADGKPKSVEVHYVEKLDRLIFDMGKGPSRQERDPE